MSIDYIRKTYGVTCKVGQRVRYSPPGETPREGKIVGARDGYLRIKPDPLPKLMSATRSYHPTWYLEFLK